MALRALLPRAVIDHVLMAPEAGVPAPGHRAVARVLVTAGAGAAPRVDVPGMGGRGGRPVAGQAVRARGVMAVVADRARAGDGQRGGPRVAVRAGRRGVIVVIEPERAARGPPAEAHLHRHGAGGRQLGPGVAARAARVHDGPGVMALEALAAGLHGHLSVGAARRVAVGARDVPVVGVGEPRGHLLESSPHGVEPHARVRARDLVRRAGRGTPE